MLQEKLKTMLMSNSGGQTKCVMGDAKVANSRKLHVKKKLDD